MDTRERNRPLLWFNIIGLLLSLTAAATAFLPIALYTSPWDAVRFRVPGNQGNWWHFLIGAPFFLAFPMVWLHIRSLSSTRPSTRMGRRVIWTLVALSLCGTIAVTVPFLLRLGNLAHMKESRWLSILGPTLGIIIASGAMLFVRRRDIIATSACLAGLYTAYLANAAFCVAVYAPMPGTAGSRAGSITTLVILWPMLLEMAWIFVRSFKNAAMRKRNAATAIS